ncbi:hypothetical protein ACOWOQ_04085 [Helicobacter pylori]
MNQNTEQVSQNKGLNEFERAKVYYTKKVADNLLHIANPINKVEAPYKSDAKLSNAHFEKSTNAMIRLEHDKDYPMEKQATSNLVLKDVKDRIFNDIDKNNAFSDEQKSAYKNNIDKLFETINDYCAIKNEKYQQIFFENQKQNQTQKQVDQYSTMEF